LRQREPADFDEESFRTIDMDEGITAVIGFLKEADTTDTDTTDTDDTDKIVDLSKIIDGAEAAETAILDHMIELAKTVTKRGRVLSASNENRIREAVDMLSQVLSSLPDAKDDDDKKAEQSESKGTVVITPELLKQIPEMVHNAIQKQIRMLNGSLD
jgi:hypothetical protein